MQTYIHTAIDSIQYAKTQFLNTFVKEETVREPLQAFVNAQALFARNLVSTSSDLIDAMTKLDYTKLLKPTTV
jgi:hypothetical protein